MNNRIKLANKHKSEKLLIRTIVTDEDYSNLFSKGLKHDKNGLVDKEQMKRLLLSIHERNISSLPIKFYLAVSSWTHNVIGSSNSVYRYSSPPRLSSSIIAYDMCELYCMSITRDIEFTCYYNNHIINDCCNSLNLLDNYLMNDKVTPTNIFKNYKYPGPYISQFLFTKKYNITITGDFMKSWETAMMTQNGNISEQSNNNLIMNRYVLTGRDLTKVVADPLSIFFDTCDVLLNMKVATNNNHIFTPLDIKCLLGIVSRNASLCCSYVKWNTMFLRPEALAIRIENLYKTENNTGLISDDLLKSNVLEMVNFINSNLLLTQVFPEGCPSSPSSCSEYATISGACVTVLKFFFDLRESINSYEPSSGTDELVDYHQKLLLEDEINKLAFNVGNSRKWAGVSYNKDIISGLKRGEKVAISCILDFISCYPQEITVDIRRLNGNYVKITNKQ